MKNDWKEGEGLEKKYRLISKNGTVVLIYSPREFQEMILSLLKKFSQRQLAKILGISRGVITDIKSGRYALRTKCGR